MLKTSPRLPLRSADNVSMVPAEIWFLIMKHMMEGSLTPYTWHAFLNAAEPSLARAMKSEFRRWLGNYNKPEDVAKNFFYSEARKKIFLGKLIYDLETCAISNGPPECDWGLPWFHSDENSYFVSKNNIVYGCGLNKKGELGLGHNEQVNTPTPITKFPAGTVIKDIVTCFNSTFFVTNTDKVFVCGDNKFGQLGLEHKEDVHTPTLITRFPDDVRIEKIVSDALVTFFITTSKSDNTQKIFACGDNFLGQLSVEPSAPVLTPTLITAFPPNTIIKNIVTNGLSTFFITTSKSDGAQKIFACGSNAWSQLGLGHPEEVDTATLITAFPPNTIIKNIVTNFRAGGVFTLFLTNTGKVFVCGKNEDDRFGLGDTAFVYSPELIWATNNCVIIDIALADGYIFFLTSEGKILSNEAKGIYPVKEFTEEIVLKMQTLPYNKGLIFITADSTAIKFHISEIDLEDEHVDFSIYADFFRTITSFRLFLPEVITNFCDEQTANIPLTGEGNKKFKISPTRRDETAILAENTYYSPARHRFFWNHRVYDTAEKSFVYSVLPLYHGDLRCFHSAENSFYVMSRSNIFFAEGLNKQGELGLGHAVQVNTPTPINTFPPNVIIEKIVTDNRVTFFITTTKADPVGKVFACGDNSFGQLGLGYSWRFKYPTLIAFPRGTSVENIVTNGRSTFFITKTGSVFFCGINSDDVLGWGHTHSINFPQRIETFPPGTSVENIVTNGRSTFFITKTGSVFACGDNRLSELGLRHSRWVKHPTLIAFPRGTSVENIVTNGRSTFFITKTGGVFACGDNRLGQLGLGLRHNSVNVPSLITAFPRDTAIKNIVFSSNAVFFISHNGFVFFSGYAQDLKEDWIVKNRFSIQQIESLADLVIVQAYPYVISGKHLIIFVSADGVVIQICDNQSKTLANLRSSMSKAIIYPCNRQLEFNRLKLNKPVGWLYGSRHEYYTVSYAEAYKFTPRQASVEVFMTQWLLRYPMDKLENALSRGDTLPTIAINACNEEFRILLNAIDDNVRARPLLREHTQKSITPEIMVLASAYLNPDNIRRLGSYMSGSQIESSLALTQQRLA